MDGITETRIIGPPGTGKTTYLLRQIQRAADKHGGGSVLVTSFTKAAAKELVQRGVAVPKENAATLHSHCFRALGSPKIAEAHTQGFNEEFPQYAMRASRKPSNDDFDNDSLSFDDDDAERDGDRLYADAQRRRALCLPIETWPIETRAFWSKWEAWKESCGFADFTDLIEDAYLYSECAPGGPSVMFVDEAQDLSRLEMNLVRKWARSCEHLVLAGDPYQSIFSFKGADPAVMDGTDLPAEHRPVLHQSHRVSKTVHGIASLLIKEMPGYKPIEYAPTGQEGYLDTLGADWQSNPFPAVHLAESFVEAGETVMLLTTCSYMLDPLIRQLRDRAIPFANPYRLKRGDWNPLGPRKGVSAVDRVTAFLSQRVNGGWTMAEAKKWTEHLADVVFRKGVKKMIKDWIVDKSGDGFVPDPDAAECSNWFRSPADAERALSRNLDWYCDHLMPSKRSKTIQFAIRVAEQGGVASLRETPKVIVGTVHSVKGGEADNVILFPDLSPRASTAIWRDNSQMAEALRVGYVALTRARKGVVLCSPAARSRSMPMPHLHAVFREASKVHKGRIFS